MPGWMAAVHSASLDKAAGATAKNVVEITTATMYSLVKCARACSHGKRASYQSTASGRSMHAQCKAERDEQQVQIKELPGLSSQCAGSVSVTAHELSIEALLRKHCRRTRRLSTGRRRPTEQPTYLYSETASAEVSSPKANVSVESLFRRYAVAQIFTATMEQRFGRAYGDLGCTKLAQAPSPLMS